MRVCSNKHFRRHQPKLRYSNQGAMMPILYCTILYYTILHCLKQPPRDNPPGLNKTVKSL